MPIGLGPGLFPHEPYGDALALLDFATPYFRVGGRRTPRFPQVVGGANPTANDKRVALSPPAGDFTVVGAIVTTGAEAFPLTVFDWNDGSDSNKILLSLNASHQLVLKVVNGGATTTVATEGGAPAAARSSAFEVRRTAGDWSLIVDGALVASATAAAPSPTSLQLGNTRALGETINACLTLFQTTVPLGTLDFSDPGGAGAGLALGVL